jgi:cysteine synthase A
MAIYTKDVVELVGDTPLVRINKLGSVDRAEIFAKVEFFNPGGSVKDRVALGMIRVAEEEGKLNPGSTIIEPTSGNTGIGLAMIASNRGYKCVLVMPETMSVERRRLLTSYGAELILTPGNEGMAGAIRKCEEILANNPGFFMPQQFENPANPEVHRRTTAQEILRQVPGKIDAFVVGVGTGGTLTGVGEVLKEKFPDILIIAVEPSSSPVLSGGKPGLHGLQGIGAGFIPKVLNREIIDEVIPVKDEDALVTTKELSMIEGLLVGISSGAACWASLSIAKRLGPGKKVVTLFPDTGERYLSVLGELDETNDL